MRAHNLSRPARCLAAAAALAVVAALPVPATAQQQPDAPVLTVDPDAITAVQAPDRVESHELSIGNTGDADLDWQVVETPDGPVRRPVLPVTGIPHAEVPDPGGPGELRPYPGFRVRKGWTVPVPPPPTRPGAVTLTHSPAPALVAGSTVTCTRNRGTVTTAASYLRHFTLTDFGVTGDFDVSSVAFGVEAQRGSGSAAPPLTANLYTLVDPAGPLVTGNLALLGTATRMLDNQAMTMVEVPVTGTVPAGGTLVVEVAAPDMWAGFFPGSHPAGETAPSYLRAEACGLPEPVPTSALGFPEMQLLLNVTGDTDLPGCDVPGGTDWVDVDPTAGTVGPGATQPVAVTVDSTGRELGEVLTADLCLATGDPARRLVVVPVTLSVEADPAIEVSPGELAAELAAGETAESTVTIANTGGQVLEWEFFDERLTDRERRLQDGVLLVPDSAADRVMAFDPRTGALVDPAFIPAAPEAGLDTPVHAILNPAGDGFLLSDQLGSVVHGYDLDGTWQGVVAPAGGPDPALAENIRGIAVSPSGTLLVTVAEGGNAGTVAEFDPASGAFLGSFVDAGPIGGPYHVLFRDDDVLVTEDRTFGAGAIHRVRPDGTYDGVFRPDAGFPQQVHPLPNGDLLVAQFSTADGFTSGVWELTPDGDPIGVYSPVVGNRGVHALADGRILTSTRGGVYVVGRDGALHETVFEGTGARFISHAQVDPGCTAPADLPWLDVAPRAGDAPGGEQDEVTVTFDASAVAPGNHTALLCVDSNDPERPRVEVPVSLTVDRCHRTVTGVHPGDLTVTDGVTCLAPGSRVEGNVNVLAGAGIVATAARVVGAVATIDADTVELRDSRAGLISVRGTTGRVLLAGNTVVGGVQVVDNDTPGAPIVISGNAITGILFCLDNLPPPVATRSNTAGAALGQCEGMAD